MKSRPGPKLDTPITIIYWRIISILLSILEKFAKLIDEWLIIRDVIKEKKVNPFSVFGLFLTFPFQITLLLIALVIMTIVLVLYFPVILPLYVLVNFILSAIIFCFKLIIRPQVLFMTLGTITNWLVIYTAVQYIFGGGFFSFISAIVIAIVENFGSFAFIGFVQTLRFAKFKSDKQISLDEKTRLYIIQRFFPFLAIFLLATFAVDYAANVNRFLLTYSVFIERDVINPLFYQMFSCAMGLITIIIPIICSMLAYYWQKKWPEWRWLFQITAEQS